VPRKKTDYLKKGGHPADGRATRVYQHAIRDTIEDNEQNENIIPSQRTSRGTLYKNIHQEKRKTRGNSFYMTSQQEITQELRKIRQEEDEQKNFRPSIEEHKNGEIKNNQPNSARKHYFFGKESKGSDVLGNKRASVNDNRRNITSLFNQNQEIKSQNA